MRCVLMLVAALAGGCTLADGPHRAVALSEIRAGQYNVGLDAVEAKEGGKLRDSWEKAGGGAAGRAAVDAYLRKNPLPVIIGPGGSLHLVDEHHRATVHYLLWREFGEEFPHICYYEAVEDLSHLKPEHFWALMLKTHPVCDEHGEPVPGLRHMYFWPYNLGVMQDPQLHAPPTIPQLTDDVMRTIAEEARQAGGYMEYRETRWRLAPFNCYYQQFYWANALRNRVYLKGVGWESRGGNPNAQFVFEVEAGERQADAVRRLVATAALLCRDMALAALPGWTIDGDVRPDGSIDRHDLEAVVRAIGSTPAERYSLPTVDCNRDGRVDRFDLMIVLEQWGTYGP